MIVVSDKGERMGPVMNDELRPAGAGFVACRFVELPRGRYRVDVSIDGRWSVAVYRPRALETEASPRASSCGLNADRRAQHGSRVILSRKRMEIEAPDTPN